MSAGGTAEAGSTHGIGDARGKELTLNSGGML